MIRKKFLGPVKVIRTKILQTKVLSKSLLCKTFGFLMHIICCSFIQNRRVSFAYPLEEKRSIGDPLEFDKISDLAVPLPFGDANDTTKTTGGTPKRFTTIRKKVCSELY